MANTSYDAASAGERRRATAVHLGLHAIVIAALACASGRIAAQHGEGGSAAGSAVVATPPAVAVPELAAAPEPAAAPRPAACLKVTQSLVDRIAGAAPGTLAPTFAGLRLDRPLREAPDRFSNWRSIASFSGGKPIGMEIRGNPGEPIAAIATPEWRGAPVARLFAIYVEVPARGVADVLAARWGAPIQLQNNGERVWVEAGAQRRVRVHEYDCGTMIWYEPFMTIDQLLDLRIERLPLLGATVAAAKAASAALVEDGDCYLGDGCATYFRIPSLLSVTGPLCVYASRTELPKHPSSDLWKSLRLNSVSIVTCTTPMMERWLDELPQRDYDELKAALTKRFGAPKSCTRSEPDPDAARSPIVFERGKVGIALASHALTAYHIDPRNPMCQM